MYFTKFEIETKYNKDENIEKLKEIIYTDKLPLFSFSFDFRGKQFFGKISGEKFDIMPVIEGRNSFMPVMKGEIIGENKSRILIKMRLHLSIIIFLALMPLLILPSTINNLQNGGLIVLPIIYIVVTFMYLRESKKFRSKFEGNFK